MKNEVGDIISLQNFAYSNKEGGTGLSNWEYDERFERPANFKIIKNWEDYETGQRGWAVPDPKDEELLAYLERNARKGKPNHKIKDPDRWINSKEFTIFWSEHDILDTIEFA